MPLVPGRVSMYHCGPTVYSSPHIGNFRSFLLGDLLRRFLEDQGFAVTQVMNVTDVGHLTADDEDHGEDRMELAARREKLDPWAIAKKYEDEFRDALAKVGFKFPHHLPRATDHIAEMGAIIDDLLARGIAYQVNGNVYFEIAKFPEYGKLSKKPLDELEEGARVAVNPEKKDPRDFALWKVDPKHLMQWDAPFRGGVRGFPGWHIECSAMAMKYLGPSFDIHTGGEDNLFPHHECEVAQSEAHTGKPFVRTWLHVKHLLVEGQKMSKSLGNFTTVKDVLDRGFTGAELRYALLRAQYRQTLNFTWAGLEDGRKAIQRVRHAVERLQRVASGEEPAGSADLVLEMQRADTAFTASLNDDLNVSEALAAVFAFVTDCNKAAPSKTAAVAALGRFARFDSVLGCFDIPSGGAVVPVTGGQTSVGGAQGQGLADRRRGARRARAARLQDRRHAAGTAAGEGVMLDRTEQRIVGVLIEKELSVPESYPLTENALLAGCNQKSNRDPEMTLEEFQMRGALLALREKQWVLLSDRDGGRTARYKHNVETRLRVGPKAKPVLCELLVRGPQTPTELKNRVGRMGFHAASPEEVLAVLEELAAMPGGGLVELLPRQPRERDARWAHKLGPREAAPADAAPADAAPQRVPAAEPAPRLVSAEAARPAPGADLAERLAALERRVEQLERRLASDH